MMNISKNFFAIVFVCVICVFKAYALEDNINDFDKLVLVESVQEVEMDYPKETDINEKNASLNSLLLGKGTQSSPYQIYYVEDLLYFAECINSGVDTGAHYKLMNDIDLGGANWTPVGYYTEFLKYNNCFSGVFDGNGHTISNFTITNTERIYVGFFGFVYNGTVKNLTLSNCSVNVVSDHETLYVGSLAGRCISSGNNKSVSIENCKVENAQVYAQAKGSLYVGGLLGYAMSSDSCLPVVIKNSHANVSVEAYSTCNEENSTVKYVYAGGLVGYVGATVNTSLKIENCSSSEDVYSHSGLDSESHRVAAFAGGAVGFVGVSGVTSVVDINSCFSLGDTKTECAFPGTSGGFAAYFSVNSGVISVKNCYSLGDSYAKTISTLKDNDYTCIGSFAGFATSYTAIENCFATGNAVDKGSSDSYVGAFIGYEYIYGQQSSKIDIRNCYYTESVKIVGKHIINTATSIKSENINKQESYIGFDFEDVWSVPLNRYPCLKTNTQKVYRVAFLSNGGTFEKYNVVKGHVLVLPQQNPEEYYDEKYKYTFSHWALEKGGQEFDASAVTVSDNIDVYAFYDSEYRTFSVVFMNGKEVFDTQNLVYGMPVTVPKDVPKKQSDKDFWYRFVYWSKSPYSPDSIDISKITVISDLTIYAVFEGLDHSVWNGKDAREFSSGAGTKSYPYEIRDGYELYYLSSQVNSGNEALSKAYYKLCADIDLGNNEWIPVGNEQYIFSGELDGKGYRIKNFRISCGGNAGLFGSTSNADVHSLGLENAKIIIDEEQNDVCAGIVAGKASGKNRISKIDVANSCIVSVRTSGKAYVGAIVGCMTTDDGDSVVENCSIHAGIEAQSTDNSVYAGYVAGYVSSTAQGNAGVLNCYALGSLTVKAKTNAYAGGVVGCAEKETEATVIDGSFAVGDVQAISDEDCFVGYIVAKTNEFAKVRNCCYYEEMKADGTSVNSNVTENTEGTETATVNFRDSDFLTKNLGFDFSSVWSLMQGYDYPVLKIMYSIKPVFTVENVNLFAGTVSLDVKVLATETESYNVVLSLYSERGRLLGIKIVRITDNTIPSLQAFTVTKDNIEYTNIDKISFVKVSVLDAESLSTVFPTITKKI